jgi:hypothetical protein
MKKTSLNELMGSSGEKAKSGRKLSLDDLGELLGEKMPKLEFTPVGRLRLTNALRVRFGDGYKNIPGIDSIMKQFEDESKFRVKLEEMKMIRGKAKGK